MLKLFKSTIEPNKKIRMLEVFFIVVMLVGSLACFIWATTKINGDATDVKYVGSLQMQRLTDLEDYDENCSICDVTYASGDKTMIISYSYDEYVNLNQNSITAFQYQTGNGVDLFFDHQNVSQKELQQTYKQVMANSTMPMFNCGNALLILLASLAVVLLFSTVFTTYEKVWFMSIMVLATIFAIIFPEESANGVNGIWIMLLYLLDTFLNILCELLISKQSRYNFLVSIGVEITEIAICIVLMYRFATMVTTLFFWLPIDIISYINWSKHKDEQQDELTIVRRLKGYQEVLIILGIVAWTVVVGYLLSGLNIVTDFYNNEALQTAIVYIDACASAVGIANGLFIFFRLREQWVAWYICAALEAVINILSGQYVLLILKLGYFTNTTYGYIKWSQYIKTHNSQQPTLF